MNTAFHDEDKNKYLVLSKVIYERSIEKYIETVKAANVWTYTDLGLTDLVILLMARQCGRLISGGSTLCDYACSMDIPIFDFKTIHKQNKI